MFGRGVDGVDGNGDCKGLEEALDFLLTIPETFDVIRTDTFELVSPSEETPSWASVGASKPLLRWLCIDEVETCEVDETLATRGREDLSALRVESGGPDRTMDGGRVVLGEDGTETEMRDFVSAFVREPGKKAGDARPERGSSCFSGEGERNVVPAV